MRRTLFTACALCMAIIGFAQSTPKKAKNLKWKQGGIFSVIGAQTGSRNWTAAPEKYSLTGIASLYLFANKSWGKKFSDDVSLSQWYNSLDLAYGVSNVQSAGIRKVDDKLDIYSRYSLNTSKNAGVGLISNLRTQFSNGYDYSEDIRKRVSGFFAPAFLTFSLGAHVHLAHNSLTSSFGPMARWVIVSNSPYSYNYQGGIKPNGTPEMTTAAIYGVDPARTSRFEYGAMWSTTFEHKLCKNVQYRGRLDATSDFKSGSIGNIDIYWTNNFTMHVNKWLKVIYSYDLVYDDDVKILGPNKNRPGTQMRSALGVGVAVGF